MSNVIYKYMKLLNKQIIRYTYDTHTHTKVSLINQCTITWGIFSNIFFSTKPNFQHFFNNFWHIPLWRLFQRFLTTNFFPTFLHFFFLPNYFYFPFYNDSFWQTPFLAIFFQTFFFFNFFFFVVKLFWWFFDFFFTNEPFPKKK